ncbi:MAG TPA: dihydroxyacetone kinase subunit L [Terriglobia bacterium]|jgi:dihydroxyacetone kinase-like protein|nr:dihydroxyacetone kinase subunit L [Terriglobia bacterium]
MTTGLTTASLREGLERIIRKLEVCADELNSLDAALGDGDLGVTMVRGGRSVQAELPGLPEDIGLALMKCAQAFTRISGSTLGTLLATGLMSVAKATKGRREIPWSEVSSLLAGATETMIQRGQAQLGDKTILDALDAARKAIEGLDDPKAQVLAADAAVAAAIEKFRPQPARQGRARIFGEKSRGRDDPGMVAFKRMIEGLL